jgi:hypothetical protein
MSLDSSRPRLRNQTQIAKVDLRVDFGCAETSMSQKITDLDESGAFVHQRRGQAVAQEVSPTPIWIKTGALQGPCH